MKFTNSLGNSLTPKSLRSAGKENASACLIENKDYIRKNKTDEENKDRAYVIVSPPAIFTAVLVAGLLLHKFLPLGVLLQSSRLSMIIGNILFVISGFIMVSTALLMIKKKTALRPDKKTTTIVTTGFFRYSRNPLYISLMLVYCGITAHVNALWLLLLLPVLFIALDTCVVRYEEKYLEEKFGEVYLQYKKNVRRWI